MTVMRSPRWDRIDSTDCKNLALGDSGLLTSLSGASVRLGTKYGSWRETAHGARRVVQVGTWTDVKARASFPQHSRAVFKADLAWHFIATPITLSLCAHRSPAGSVVCVYDPGGGRWIQCNAPTTGSRVPASLRSALRPPNAVGFRWHFVLARLATAVPPRLHDCPNRQGKRSGRRHRRRDYSRTYVHDESYNSFTIARQAGPLRTPHHAGQKSFEDSVGDFPKQVLSLVRDAYSPSDGWHHHLGRAGDCNDFRPFLTASAMACDSLTPLVCSR